MADSGWEGGGGGEVRREGREVPGEGEAMEEGEGREKKRKGGMRQGKVPLCSLPPPPLN